MWEKVVVTTPVSVCKLLESPDLGRFHTKSLSIMGHPGVDPFVQTDEARVILSEMTGLERLYLEDFYRVLDFAVLYLLSSTSTYSEAILLH